MKLTGIKPTHTCIVYFRSAKCVTLKPLSTRTSKLPWQQVEGLKVEHDSELMDGL